MRQLIFLGSAAGMPIASSSTSILIEDERTSLLLDTSGGHNILGAFHSAGKDLFSVERIFISHHDSDHILGIVPLVRVFKMDPIQRVRTVYCSKDTQAAIEAIFTYTASRHYDSIRKYLVFDTVADGDQRVLGSWNVTFFDVDSTKTPQLGCSIVFPDGKRVSYLGDEPLRGKYLGDVRDSDVLLHEAYCTSDQAHRFKPHEKHHSTAREAGQNATKARAKLLALFHMEDETLATRKAEYLADARASGYQGQIFVPRDLDRLPF